MTTLVLTKEAFAHDHGVMISTFPDSYVVDTTVKKIFISHNEQFMFGFAGQLKPEECLDQKVQDILMRLIHEAIQTNLTTDALTTEIDNEQSAELVASLLGDRNGHMLVATKHHRFVFMTLPDKPCLRAITGGEVVGVGSGGAFIEGLIEGGLALEQAWPHLHDLDSLTSTSYSTYYLNDLKEWDFQP